MAAWLHQPVMFDSSHTVTCHRFTPDQCQYYKNRWHNWYVADWTFALPTVAFFMCTIGIFIIGHIISQAFNESRKPGRSVWRRIVASIRYLSYRGFRIDALGWNSASIGVLMLGAIGAIYFCCMDLIPSPYYWPGTDKVWGNSPPLGTRSGWLALACMPFLFATPSKANWISLLTGVTHEKLQVFHRWIAYAFFILALMHTFPFIVWHIRNHDMVHQVNVSNVFEYWTGIVALIFQAWLTGASWGPIRNLGYEFFKAAHFLSAVVFMLIFFWHCSGTLTSWHYFVATAAIYVPCWIYPHFRTIFEHGIGQKAQILIEDNGFTRITIPANFNWHPGQHCFLRFPSFGIHALTSHPFTICSLPSRSPGKPSEMVFYIRHRGGFTARLYNYAMTQVGVKVSVLVDGPYGGIDNRKFFNSNRLLVIAGGSGAGWMLPFVEQYLRYLDEKGVKGAGNEELQEHKQSDDEQTSTSTKHRPRSLRLILATRDTATRTWFRTALNEILSTYESVVATVDLKVEVHLTGESSLTIQGPLSNHKLTIDLERSSSSSDTGEDTTEKHAKDHIHTATPLTSSSSEGREGRHGRPDLPSLIREEAARAEERGDKVGAFVCGPLEMQNDVRNAVAEENLKIVKDGRAEAGGMYLHLEHFSWA